VENKLPAQVLPILNRAPTAGDQALWTAQQAHAPDLQVASRYAGSRLLRLVDLLQLASNEALKKS